MAKSALERKGVSVEDLPLEKPSKLPTVAEARAEGSADERWLGQLEISQPWAVVERSTLVVQTLHDALSHLAVHTNEAGFHGTYDNAFNVLPDDATGYLESYRELGQEVMSAIYGGGSDLTVAELAERITGLVIQGETLLSDTVDGVSQVS
jgi:hypothetical protein